MSVPVLEARNITKRFPGVLANDDVSFTLEKGEIHALLGENGAGKSTLMNIFYGLYQPTSGDILVNGKPIAMHSPHDAIDHGIGMVHQHFMLVEPLTVTENIVLGDETVKSRWKWLGRFAPLNTGSEAEKVRKLSEQYGLSVDPHATISDLPVGAQQRVEIVKVLYRGADILILDEPTAVLTPQEADELFVIMRALVAQGKSIIFITHKLREVFEVANRISVMRRGQMIGTVLPSETTREHLAEMMVGREVVLQVAKGEASPAGAVLTVDNLKVKDDRGAVAVNGASLQVHAGEILGVAGVQGNGQTELVEAITGLRTSEGGTVTILDENVTNRPPRVVTEKGTAHIPEDRHKYGVVLSYTIADNLVLDTYYMSPFASGLVTHAHAVDAEATRLVEEFDIRTPSVYTPVGSLSGGNQQKVVVAREFGRPIKLLIAAQPTRGIDVGSIEFIHNRIVQARDGGAAVLLVSAELDEIMALSDRIAVMYHGGIIATLSAKEATRERLGALMAGLTSAAAPTAAPAATDPPPNPAPGV
ncbi:MAG: ABC transporter ATP-binding protein [Anaerolineae bacterium]